MTLIIRTGETRAREIIEADGYWFDECTFIDCIVIFRGTKPFGYSDRNDFTGTKIEFHDVAALVLGTFSGLFPDDADAIKVLRAFAAPTGTMN